MVQRCVVRTISPAMSSYTCREIDDGYLISDWIGELRRYAITAAGCECGASECIHRDVLAACLKADRIGGWFYCPETDTFIETVTDWDPPFPTAEQLEADAKRARESTALWVWGDTYYETELLMREIIEQAKEEVFFAWGL